jgi:hypothetical protein
MHHNVTYLEVCVTYRQGLNWWPDLLLTDTTCYYTWQTTTWRTVWSLFHHLRLPPQETPSITPLLVNLISQTKHSSGLVFSLYSLGKDQQKTPSLNNSSFLGIVAEMCSQSSCLVMDVSSGSIILVFGSYVTITFYLQFMSSQPWYTFSFFVIYFRPVVQLFPILCCTCWTEQHVNRSITLNVLTPYILLVLIESIRFNTE